MENNKIAIVGHGFVGSAAESAFKDKAVVFLVDPKYGTSISDLKDFKPDVVLIAVPTPMIEEGDQDISILNDCLQELKKYAADSLIIVKSTVLPKYLDQFKDQFENLVFNPEFLRESSASDDFINAEFHVFGGISELCKEAVIFYKNYSICNMEKVFLTDIAAAALLKYTINCFLSTKVIFFNELNNIFRKSSTTESWERFIEGVSLDKRIGSSHMSVPGPDGRYGFGGACFPKDTKAFIEYASSLEVDTTVLKSVVKTNNKIRSGYKNLDSREQEQNVSFNN